MTRTNHRRAWAATAERIATATLLASCLGVAGTGCEKAEDLLDDVFHRPHQGGGSPSSDAGVPTPPAGERCGAATCAPGKVCCNASCGICTEPGFACIQIACLDGGLPAPPTVACRSSLECGPGDVCSVEAGECLPPPGCGPGKVCPAVCYGTCRPKPPGNPVACGSTVCEAGLECCNPSCGKCVKPGQACTQELCVKPPAPTKCRTSADCRVFADYCTGCDCRALGANDLDPVCSGPGVRCLVDPCARKVPTCEQGICGLAASSSTTGR